MKTIIAIQHTQSEQHINGMIGSWTDYELTTLGRQQAKQIGQSLAGLIGGQDYVLYSSDLARAKQTATFVGNALHIEPQLTQVLRERNLGEACGKSKEWAHAHTIVWEKTVDDRPFHGAETRRDT